VERRRAHGARIGAGEARNDRRVGGERDDVARWERPVVLLHGEVLVHHAAVLEEREAHDGALLDTDRDRDGAHPLRELAAEPRELLRVAVGRVVVHGDPPATRRDDHGSARPAGEPGDELVDGTLDGGQVVGLHVDRAEAAARRLVPEPALELRPRRDELQLVLAEAPARIRRAGGNVRRADLERHVLCLRERGHDFACERRRDAAASVVRHDVEVGEAGEARRLRHREREADRPTVLLGEQRDLVAHDLRHLLELVLDVHVDVRRQRALAEELEPELAQGRQIVLGRSAYVGHGTRSPTSR
jgi:hypothetical protein